jgi:hypothetical protein
VTYVVAGTITFPSPANALIGFGGYPGTGSQPKIDCAGAGPYSIWIDQNSKTAYTVTWASSYQAGKNVGPGFQGAGTIPPTSGSKDTQMFLTDPVQGFTLVALTPMYSRQRSKCVI